MSILWHCILEKSKGNQPRCLSYSCHLLARWTPYPDKEGSRRIGCARLTGLECWVGMQTLHLEAPLCMLHRLLSQKQRLLQAVTACSPLVAGLASEGRGEEGGVGRGTGCYMTSADQLLCMTSAGKAITRMSSVQWRQRTALQRLRGEWCASTHRVAMTISMSRLAPTSTCLHPGL